MRRPALLLALLPLLGGCNFDPFSQDPIDKPGTWAPEGVNDANLRAMVANPQDLVAGAGTANSTGAEAAPPVGLLLSGKRTPLMSESSLNFGAAPAAPAPQGGSTSAGAQQ
jgi:hypothetical protein